RRHELDCSVSSITPVPIGRRLIMGVTGGTSLCRGFTQESGVVLFCTAKRVRTDDLLSREISVAMAPWGHVRRITWRKCRRAGISTPQRLQGKGAVASEVPRVSP